MGKTIIRIGAGKGKLLGVLDQYLVSLGLPKIEKSRKLLHKIETEKYILEICLLRWEDIKKYSNEFDMIIYGSDQWLESGHKSMIALKYFEQNNCRLSLIVPSEHKDKPLSYFKQHKIATGYPELAKNYIGVQEHNLVELTGSVEVSIAMGWAESIFDVVESGATAKEHGLVEYKTFVKFGAILATKKPEKIPILEDLGLIEKLEKGKIIAFDGNDGSGKSTIAKHLVQEGIGNTAATVLMCPYSGYIGQSAKSLLANEKPLEWAILVGLNHWKPPINVNKIYDRSIMTCLTELIKANVSKEKILEVIDAWGPLPDVLFYCKVDIDTILDRIKSREIHDEFDEKESLKEYGTLYDHAYDFIKENTDINIVELNTKNSVESVIANVRKEI